MKVLLVTSRYPLPAWRGNQVRTVEWLAALADHDVMLLCPQPVGGSGGSFGAEMMFYRPGPGARALGVLGSALNGRPFQEGLYAAKNARTAVRSALENWCPDVVVVQMVRCGWAADVVATVPSPPPIVFDAIDSMGLHFDRADRNARQPMAGLFRSESQRCRRREAELAAVAKACVAVSARDLEWLEADGGRGWVIPVAGKVVASSPVPNREPVVVLTGNLGYRPTVRGAKWFADAVWPGIQSTVAGAKWILAGARPAAAVRKLARLEGVEIHADVADLAPFLTKARVAIAPMSSGSGVPMKVLEAMAAGVPAVVHPWAAEGLLAECREGVAVAGDDQEWVAAVKRLLLDDLAAETLSKQGRESWQRYYHPDRVADQIRAVIADAAAG